MQHTIYAQRTCTFWSWSYQASVYVSHPYLNQFVVCATAETAMHCLHGSNYPRQLHLVCTDATIWLQDQQFDTTSSGACAMHLWQYCLCGHHSGYSNRSQTVWQCGTSRSTDQADEPSWPCKQLNSGMHLQCAFTPTA